MLYFAAVITLLVEETNRYKYYQQCLDFLDNEPSPTPDITESEIFLFLAIIIQMGQYIHNNLKDYWSVLFIFLWQNNEMWQILHILRVLHSLNSDNAFDSNDPN
jgi:hypothetical protein